MFTFGREICRRWETAVAREWLVTNGIGGFASGTIAGALTRRYHGLLIAALQPPLGRMLLLSRLDETATYNGGSYPLSTNMWSNGWTDVDALRYLEAFELEGTTPVWTFAVADAILQKRVWMEQGSNTTYIRYDLTRAVTPLKLFIKALVNCRDYHSNTHEERTHFSVQPIPNGAQIVGVKNEDGKETQASFYLLSQEAAAAPHREWYYNYFFPAEAERGLDAKEDNFYAVSFELTLSAGQSLTLCASTTATPNLDGADAYARRQAYERQLIQQSGYTDQPVWVRQLVLAADQFIVKRHIDGNPDGRTVIAGYHWFSDWGRDTMISLPGLTLVTGRYQEAAGILRTFAQFVDAGLLPNLFPDQGKTPEYNSIDATLWYFEAIRAYYASTQDKDLLADLFPVLKDIVDWHIRGTRYNIKVDPTDGLLYGGQEGMQLTWMDVKVDDWVVTPRIGKPVEVNALWYNALCIMADFASELQQDKQPYQTLAKKTRRGFARFWNADVGYCYDVLDTPPGPYNHFVSPEDSIGNDASLRPNQIIAVSLPYSPLTPQQQRAVVDVCGLHLLTSFGLRSLDPRHPNYIGVYTGDRRRRDTAYHQGTVWSWLIGPFIAAHWRVYHQPELARSFLKPLIHHLEDAGLGSVSEIFSGDPPFPPCGCIAQAWGVGEFLRVWRLVSSPHSSLISSQSSHPAC